MTGKLKIGDKKVRWSSTNNRIMVPPATDQIKTALDAGHINGTFTDSNMFGKRIVTWTLLKGN